PTAIRSPAPRRRGRAPPARSKSRSGNSSGRTASRASLLAAASAGGRSSPPRAKAARWSLQFRERDAMAAWREVTGGLMFPEGPVGMREWSVLVVEIARGTLTRILPDGMHQIVAHTGGGPNGAAIGPDGRCYVCNNGGFKWHEEPGVRRPFL